MSSTTKELERIKYKFLNRNVETKAKRNFDHSTEILGKIIGPFVAGNQYKMEYWIAKSFIKNDILELTDKERLDVQKVQKIAFKEGRSGEINNIDNNLFTSIKENLSILSYRNKKSKELTTDKELRTFFSNAQDLVTIRHRKIVNLSQMKQTIRRQQNLTDEEKILISNISDDFADWRKYYLDAQKKRKN
ncbi:MAG: hypothetical protein GY870_16195 [archaeon]|nr:hypothetical protein [archaeon]